MIIGSEYIAGTSLAVQWLGLHLPVHGMRAQSLVGDLGSHMPWGNWAATKFQQRQINIKKELIKINKWIKNQSTQKG